MATMMARDMNTSSSVMMAPPAPAPIMIAREESAAEEGIGRNEGMKQRNLRRIEER